MKFNPFRWPGLFLVFVLVWFFALNLRQLLDYDVWYQLLAGQEAFKTMSVPKAEFYIYSALGEPSLFVGWLWGLLLYLAWLAGGYPLTSVFCALVWALTFGVAVAAMLAKIARDVPLGEAYSRKAQVAAALIGTSVAYQYLMERAVFRGEVTFYFAWVLAIYLSAGIVNDRQRLRRFLIAVPLLSWSLGWFHTTSVFMVLLLAGHMVQAAVDTMRNQGYAGLRKFSVTDLWPWLASIFAAVVLPCLNPNGVQQALPLIASLADVIHRTFIGEPGSTAVHVNFEYRKLVDVPVVWPIAILFLVSSLIIIWRDKSHRVANALFLSVGLLLSLLHIRALAIWAIFLMVPLGVAIAPLLQKAAVALESRRRGALLIALVVMCCFWNAGTLFNKESKRWGIGYSPRPADEKLLNEIRANMPDGGRIFNWFPLGGYLRWHLGSNFLVAIDGHLTNPKSAAWNAYYDIEDVRDQGLSRIDKWNIRAVYHPVLTPPHGYVHWLPHDLVYSENWRLVAGDQIGLLFVRAGKGEVDEQTRNASKIAYWRRVVFDVTFNASVFGSQDDKEEKRKVIEFAQQRIMEAQAPVK
jgi:hypothetical protein